MSCDNSNLFTFEQGTHNQRVTRTTFDGRESNSCIMQKKTTKYNLMHLRKKNKQKKIIIKKFKKWKLYVHD